MNLTTMKVIQVDDYDDLSQLASKRLISTVKQKPNAVLGLATGSTPLGLYRNLIKDHQENGTSYQQVHTVNLDEYIGLSKENPNSYYSYMVKNLFQYLDIPPHHIHLPHGDADDLSQECERYEKVLEGLGTIDLQVLGIGGNGHIGFNEPGTPFSSRTHIIDLNESTRQANARFFNHIDEVPRQAITMGIATIMKSKEIILLSSGEAKAEATYQLINGEITEQLPASILKRHPAVTVIVDKAAASLLN